MAIRGERSPSSQRVVLSPQAESLRAHMRHERHSRHSHRRRRRYCARPSPIMPRPRVAQLSTRADCTMLREGNVGAGNMRRPNHLAVGTKHPKPDAAVDSITQAIASHVVSKHQMQCLSGVHAVLRSEPRKPRRRCVTVDSALADDQHTNTLPSQYYKVAPRRGQPRACCFKDHEAPNRG
jgi:hypothetical protein